MPTTPLKNETTTGNSAVIRLAREFLPYRGKMAVVVFLGLVISAIQPVSVRLSQQVIDELQGKTSSGLFTYLPWILIAVFVVSGLAKYFHNALRRFVTEKILMRFREGLFDRFCRMPLERIDSTRTGELLSHIQNDLAQISSGMETLCDLVKEPFTFFGLMGVAFYCDWVLTLTTLLVAPLVAYLFSASGAAVKRYSQKNLSQFSGLMALSQEALVGARVVKVFRMESTLLDKFRAVHEQYFQTFWKSIKVQELGTPLVELIGAILMAGVIAYGGHRVAAGYLTTGELIAFIIAIGLSQMPIKKLNNSYLKLKNAEAAADRVYRLLEADLSHEKHTGARRLDQFQRRIEFSQVTLKYGDKLALDQISFHVGVGECVALVGQSGGGKTSLVNLLPRLYKPSSGEIRIDGVPLEDIYLPDLRQLFSFVTQDTFLFHDTIFENIRFGRPSATRAEVLRAAEQAHCLDFVERCPEGFDTVIGDRGVCLSGGERQRVAIARAILKNSPILVLDEATSSLDAQSEALVQEALGNLMVGKTTFLIAHRFSTIRKANRIFVLENARIIEEGTHETLATKGGLYRELFDQQMAWGKDSALLEGRVALDGRGLEIEKI